MRLTMAMSPWWPRRPDTRHALAYPADMAPGEVAVHWEPRGGCAAQSVAAIYTYVPGSNGPGSEKPSIDSTFV
jgi:hypothetical protein